MRAEPIAILATAILTVGFACSDDTDEPTTPTGFQYELPTSPDAVLRNFVSALVEEDIDAIDAALADTFQFRYFDPGPADLNYAQIMTVLENMFDEAVGVEALIDIPGAVPSTYTTEFPADDGYQMIVVSNPRLEVETSRDEGQGPITYLVDDEENVFVFRESGGRWEMVLHEDRCEAPPEPRVADDCWYRIYQLF